MAGQAGQPDSVLELYRAMLRLRRETPELRTGAHACSSTSPSRSSPSLRGGSVLCIFNLSPERHVVRLAGGGAMALSQGVEHAGELLTLHPNGFAIMEAVGAAEVADAVARPTPERSGPGRAPCPAPDPGAGAPAAGARRRARADPLAGPAGDLLPGHRAGDPRAAGGRRALDLRHRLVDLEAAVPCSGAAPGTREGLAPGVLHRPGHPLSRQSGGAGADAVPRPGRPVPRRRTAHGSGRPGDHARGAPARRTAAAAAPGAGGNAGGRRARRSRSPPTAVISPTPAD